jgi:hypothetical protein
MQEGYQCNLKSAVAGAINLVGPEEFKRDIPSSIFY